MVHGGASTVIPGAHESVIVESPPMGRRDTHLELTDMDDAGIAVDIVTLIDQYPCTWTEAGSVKNIPVPAAVASPDPVAINDNGWVHVKASKIGAGARGDVLVPARENWLWIKMAPTTGAGDTQLYGINEKRAVIGAQKLNDGHLPWRVRWAGRFPA